MFGTENILFMTEVVSGNIMRLKWPIGGNKFNICNCIVSWEQWTLGLRIQRFLLFDLMLLVQQKYQEIPTVQLSNLMISHMPAKNKLTFKITLDNTQVSSGL